jgi:predicted Zn-dependent peptidase
MESTAAHAEWVGECLIQHKRVIRPDEALALIDQVTVAEVREIAAFVFQVENEALAEIRPA